MPEPVVEIPNRPAFRASEVCELAQIPPYVLKSWEKEFPGLGIEPKPGAARIYRRTDVEHVLRIKELLFKHGMTLAGARRKLEGEPKVEEEPLPELPVTGEVREKVVRIKQGLRSLLDMLSTPAIGVRPESRAQAADIPPESTDSSSPTPAGSVVPEPGTRESGAAGDLPLLEGVAEHAADAGKPARRPRRRAGRPPS